MCWVWDLECHPDAHRFVHLLYRLWGQAGGDGSLEVGLWGLAQPCSSFYSLCFLPICRGVRSPSFTPLLPWETRLSYPKCELEEILLPFVNCFGWVFCHRQKETRPGQGLNEETVLSLFISHLGLRSSWTYWLLRVRIQLTALPWNKAAFWGEACAILCCLQGQKH